VCLFFNHNPVVSFYTLLECAPPKPIQAFEVIDSGDFVKQGYEAPKRTITLPTAAK